MGYEFHIEVQKDLADYTHIFFIDLFSDNFFKKIYFYLNKKHVYNTYLEIKKKNLLHKVFVLLSESPIVKPWNYKLEYHQGIGRFFTWDKQLVDNKKYFHYHVPFGDTAKEFECDFNKRKLLMDISGNKFSSEENELYSFRRNTIQYLDKNYENDFDLYGFFWGSDFITKLKLLVRYGKLSMYNYQTYKGLVDNKSDVISQYKYVICYENVQYNDYISNRIFDIFVNGSIPIYCGPSNIYEYIPKGTFINRTEFSSDEELMIYIKTIDEMEYLKILLNIQQFLKTKSYEDFTSKGFVQKILTGLNVANDGKRE